jgi:hypothetical protein
MHRKPHIPYLLLGILNPLAKRTQMVAQSGISLPSLINLTTQNRITVKKNGLSLVSNIEYE